MERTAVGFVVRQFDRSKNGKTSHLGCPVWVFPLPTAVTTCAAHEAEQPQRTLTDVLCGVRARRPAHDRLPAAL